MDNSGECYRRVQLSISFVNASIPKACHGQGICPHGRAGNFVGIRTRTASIAVIPAQACPRGNGGGNPREPTWQGSFHTNMKGGVFVMRHLLQAVSGGM